MKPQDFAREYLPFAKETQAKTGINSVVILAQAALESGWGNAAPGNMFFGVKDVDGINGNEQLLVTTEYSKRADLTFPEILSITPVIRNGQKYFKYRVRDFFRKYDTPEACFTDHANFFVRNKRYAKAMNVCSDCNLFAMAIAKAGYATAPNYGDTLKAVIKTINKFI